MALSKIYAEAERPWANYAYIEVTLRKYDYLHVVQGHYGHCGWEDVAQSEERSEAIADIRAYRGNCPEFPHRIVRRRELNPVYEAMLKNKHRITSDGRIVLERGWEWPPAPRRGLVHVGPIASLNE